MNSCIQNSLACHLGVCDMDGNGQRALSPPSNLEQMFWPSTGHRQPDWGGCSKHIKRCLRNPPQLPSAAGWKVTEALPEAWWDRHHTERWPSTSFFILMLLFFCFVFFSMKLKPGVQVNSNLGLHG